MSITVFPTVVHSFASGATDDAQASYSQSYDYDSSRIIEAFLIDNGYATPYMGGNPVELPMPGLNQGTIMSGGLTTLVAHLEQHRLSTDYMMLVEVVIMDLPGDEGGEGVWIIDFYMLNSDGEDAFSFVLNSQWDLFNEANLFAGDKSNEADLALTKGAVQAVVDAIRSHVESNQ